MMSADAAGTATLERQLEVVRAELAEAHDTLRAIREGEVDAVVVTTRTGNQIFTLRGADQAYRAVVEQMGEGAATVSLDGVVLYCNAPFAAMFALPRERIIGLLFGSLFAIHDQTHVMATLGLRSTNALRVHATTGTGSGRTVRLTATYVASEQPPFHAVTLTDITAYEQRESELLRAQSRAEQQVVSSAARLEEMRDEFLRQTEQHETTARALTSAETRITEDSQNIDRLQRLGSRYVSEAGLESILRDALLLAADFVPSHGGVIAMASSSGQLTPLVSSGTLADLDSSSLDLGDCSKFFHGHAGPRMVQDLHRSGGLPVGVQSALRDRGIENCLLLPFTSQRQSQETLLGVLVLAPHRVDPLSVREARLLALLATEISALLERYHAENELRRIEWMLRPEEDRLASKLQTAPAEDIEAALLERNQGRLILDSVGRPILDNIVRDYHDLLGTTACVFEADGSYAKLNCSGGWCATLCGASRAAADAKGGDPLNNGAWRCHEARWTRSSRVAIESGSSADVACDGGMRVLAVPVRDGETIVGAVSMCYGDPPRDATTVTAIAETFETSAQELGALSAASESRPAFIVDLARRRLEAASTLIGEIVGRKRAEQERANLARQLVEAQKMESIAMLAGGVAHDFNNMLSVILAESEVALEDANASEEIKGSLCEIQGAARRSSDLTRQLLAFARRQAVTPRIVDINDIITGQLKMLRRLVGEDITVTWTPGAALGMILVDPSQIDQLLANLVVNARDAIAGAGSLQVESSRVVTDPAWASRHPGTTPGEHVELIIRDTGKGMDHSILAHVFEPFFTTKRVGEGTGLGLATVHGIVRQNHGAIEVESEVGVGTTFHIYLPCVAPEAAQAAAAVPAAPPRGSGQRILLVEDEGALLSVCGRMLRHLGYDVTGTSDPLRALELARQSTQGFELLLTDVIMPGMNGLELSKAITDARPEIRTLYMSGYTADIIAQRGVIDPGVQLIQKPFMISDLAGRVHHALGAGVRSRLP